MSDARVQPEPRYSGTTAATISTAIVGLLHDYTGRGPTHAHTTFGPDMIVVTLRDCLTAGERTLAQRGLATEVLAMRRSIQHAMRDDMIAAVQAATGATVGAFLGDNLHDPDIAVEIFLMRSSDTTEA
jgi:uncharacterized protein YbcI